MEKIVAVVEYRTKWGKQAIKGIIVFIILFALGFITSDSSSFSGIRMTHINWYGCNIFNFSQVKDGGTIWRPGIDFGITLLLIIILFLIIQFFILFYRKTKKNQAKRTSLYVVKDKIYGSYYKILKKEVVIPIDQVDQITVTSEYSDKIRTGKTLTICSSSGKIEFHYIQNADEVSNAILAMINANKNNCRSTNNPTFQISIADELKKYKELLDSGIITQEEFDTKKIQLLGL